MNLKKKKKLAVKTLGVGKERIIFIKSRLGEIKEAITRQDIKDLYKTGAIVIREIKGRRNIKKKRGRSPGKIRKVVNKRKERYVALTRSLRSYIKRLKDRGAVSEEEAKEMRKRIRNKEFRSKTHMKEFIKERK